MDEQEQIIIVPTEELLAIVETCVKTTKEIMEALNIASRILQNLEERIVQLEREV